MITGGASLIRDVRPLFYMNALFETTFKGTLGELIAQTFLLAHGVQAAAPIKDSGNDLIAVRGHSFRALQVRTSKKGSIHKPEPDRAYHILAAVHLPFDADFPLVHQARVFLFRAQDVAGLKGTVDDYPKALISDTLVLELWPDTGLEPTAVGAVSSAPRFISRASGGSALDR
jgi:hypothetical protein